MWPDELLPIEVETVVDRDPEADWPDLTIAVDFSQPVTDLIVDKFEGLVLSWYDVAVHGGFGGRVHNMDDTPYLIAADGAGSWWVDMGSAPKEALDVLIRAIEGFARGYRIPHVHISLL